MSAKLEAAKAKVIRNVKALGFATPYQLSLYESAIGYHWLAYGGMGTTIDLLANPDETDAIVALLKSGLLVRLDDATLLNDGTTAYRIILKVDMQPTDTLRKTMPNHGPYQSFIRKWRTRGTKSTDFRGLVEHDLSRNSYQKQRFTWVYYAGMGEVRYEDVTDDDVTLIDQMLALGLLRRGNTYERPLTDGGLERVTDLHLRT
jgi:hypothetical protein